MTNHLYKNDLPATLGFGAVVAIDTETLGLSLVRDRLCLVQLTFNDGDTHLVQIPKIDAGGNGGLHHAPHLAALLEDSSITKIFHFARFDVAMLRRHLGVTMQNIYCTKIASKLVRTYTDKHGLKDICRELLGLDLNKQQQSSDWAAETLTEEQKAYAASDVLHLHALKAKLDFMLEREGRDGLARAMFDFLPIQAELDLLGWSEENLFAHS